MFSIWKKIRTPLARSSKSKLWCGLLNYVDYCEIKVSTTDASKNNANKNDMKTRDDEKFGINNNGRGIDIADSDDDLSKEKALLAKNNVKILYQHHYALFDVLFKDVTSGDPFSGTKIMLFIDECID